MTAPDREGPTHRTWFESHEWSGRLVVVEGTDGAGKTTLLDRLADELFSRGYDVLQTRQPTTEARSLPIYKRYIYEPEQRASIDYLALMCVILADRLQHCHEVIKPALRRGAVVLCDRYAHTQIAALPGRGYPEAAHWILEAMRGMVQPDLAFLCDVSLDVAVARIRERSTFEGSFVELDHLDRMQREYRRLAAENVLQLVDTSAPDPSIALDSMLPEIESCLSRGPRPTRVNAGGSVEARIESADGA